MKTIKINYVDYHKDYDFREDLNTINQNLPLFKNMQQQLISDSSNYENIKPKQKMPLSRIDIQASKFISYLLYYR